MQKFFLILLMIAGFGAFNAQTAHAELQPSFDCAKASTKVEKLICSDEALAGKDRELAEKVAQVRSGYSGTLHESFIKGQRTWLKLRNEACGVEDVKVSPIDQINCLNSVYSERLQQLLQYKILADAHKNVNLDLILDDPGNLTDPYIDMYFNYGNHELGNKWRKPQTCRELYTMSSGLWMYILDTIHDKAKGFDLQNCGFKILSALGSINKQNKFVDFHDLSLYSTEFICLSGLPGCRDSFEKDQVVSFNAAEKAGKIKILRSENLNLAQDTNQDENKVLVIDKDAYSIAGEGTSIFDLKTGNFTHQDRQEALISIGLYPSSGQGTWSSQQVMVIYYDPAKQAIRPGISIDTQNPFLDKQVPTP